MNHKDIQEDNPSADWVRIAIFILPLLLFQIPANAQVSLQKGSIRVVSSEEEEERPLILASTALIGEANRAQAYLLQCKSEIFSTWYANAVDMLRVFQIDKLQKDIDLLIKKAKELH